MNNSFSEQRLCFKAEDQNVHDGDPQWSFGDLPYKSQFRFNDGIRDGNTSYTKDGENDASVVLSEGRVVRMVGRVSPKEDTPVRNVIVPATEDIRARFDAVMRQPNYMMPMPAALAMAFEKANIAEADRAREALAAGGVVYGPEKNPLDTLREWIDWSEVPSGAFFCLHQKPESYDQIYLRVGGDYVMKICDYQQWCKGLKGFNIRNETVNIKTVLSGRRGTDNLGALVLSAETPEEFDRVLKNSRERSDASPPSEARDTHHQELRDKNNAFWRGVEERKKAA